ncbi:MAG: right-handed parallel beta-helix repeat-containing protein [Roseovarius sp.]|nr:right-handed parallel beta-helix repeat-containing protein [Roseovarius sp.]
MTIFSVSNSEELLKALASAKGGDTIELAGGDYGNLTLIDGRTPFNVTFDGEVTIRSADAEQPASFSRMDLRGVSNLTFDGIVFDYQFSLGDPLWVSPFKITAGSDSITIKNSIFDGDLASGVSEIDDGYGYGKGLVVQGSSNISVLDSEFYDWHRGATFGKTDGIDFSGNELYSLRSDGVNFSTVTSVIIENNYFHDFKASPDSLDHRDMIQFWTNGGTTPSIDIVIRGNILDIGEGSLTQSIFMRNDMVDRGLAGEEMYYQNILIENNTIYNAQTHGITVGETDGLVVRNNTILHVEGEMHGAVGSVTIPKINVSPDSKSVVIEENITAAINGFNGQSDWSVASNALLQPSEYFEHFITSSLDAVNGAHSYTILPNGYIESLNAGSTAAQFSDVSNGMFSQFLVRSDASSAQTLVFDASLTVGPFGLVSEEDAEFIWTFGDGTTATGQVVAHEFAKAGHYDVTLKVIAQDGTTSLSQVKASIAGADILAFDAESGWFEALAFGEERALDAGALPLSSTADGLALKLGGAGKQASIDPNELSRFFGNDNFELSMTLKAGHADSWGEVARIHGSFITGVDQNGNFSLDLFPEDGSRLRLKSSGVDVTDGQSHDIIVRFDGEAGFVEILIDGKVVASQSVTGSLAGGLRALDFGNPWGGTNFDGELSAFSLKASAFDFPLYDGSVAGLDRAIPVEEDTSQPAPAIPVEDRTPEETVETLSEEIMQENDPGETVTPPEPPLSEPVEPDSGEQTPSEEDSGSLEPILLKGGFKLDFANIQNTVTFHDNAHVVTTPVGSAITFDGKKDYVSLGRLTDFESSQKIAFSIDFVNENSKSSERLVWNHQKIGLTLEGDGLHVQIANNDGNFNNGFRVAGLGLDDGDRHNVIVMVDAEADRLQIVVDDVLVLDEQNTDFDFVGAGGQESGWSLGTAWNRWFDGQVYDFQVSDDFDFIETSTVEGTLLV